MNYASLIVKIIEKPIQKFFDDNTCVTEIRVKFPQNLINNFGSIIRIVIWGDLAQDVAHYYQVNDYIIIEGYISLRDNFSNRELETNYKQIEISVFKIYPFFFKNTKIDNIDK